MRTGSFYYVFWFALPPRGIKGPPELWMCLPVNRAESNPPTHPQGTGARPSFVWPYFGRRAPCAQKNISFSLKKNKKTSKITKKTTKIKKNRALSRAKRANLTDLRSSFTNFRSILLILSSFWAHFWLFHPKLHLQNVFRTFSAYSADSNKEHTRAGKSSCPV